MPSRYSSDHSLTDAEKLAAELGIDHRTIPIEPAHAAFLDMLAPCFDGPRARPHRGEPAVPHPGHGADGAVQQVPGWLVLTTGNKSEMAVGYSTLYGDTAGGFAVIKDVPKLLVYELCRDRNARAGRDARSPRTCSPSRRRPSCGPTSATTSRCRPTRCSTRSSRPTSRTTAPRAELVGMGFDPELVERITRLVDVAEYKRRQTPPGVRVTPKAFGKDRRLPITNRYRG